MQMIIKSAEFGVFRLSSRWCIL